MLIPLGFLAGSAGGGVDTDFELIESQVLSTAQSSVVFNNLGTHSSTYKHLQIRVASRTAQNGWTRAIAVRFNGDSGSNYAWHILGGEGSAVSSAAGTSQNLMYLGQSGASDATSGIFAASVIDVLDAYSTTKNKTTRALAGGATISPSRIRLFSGAWFNTASLTSITLLGEDLSSNFIAGSRFSIYGIKG